MRTGEASGLSKGDEDLVSFFTVECEEVGVANFDGVHQQIAAQEVPVGWPEGRRHSRLRLYVPVAMKLLARTLTIAPAFKEHGDEILSNLGLDMERILELRIKGAVT